jgi:hypothetical protein
LGFAKLDEVGVGWVEVGVGGCRDAGEALEEGMGGGVEELVGDAEDPMIADRLERLPVALLNDAVEGDAIPRSAPAEEQDVGIFGGDVFGCGVGTWCAKVVPAGCFDEFGDPRLGVDEGFAPLFAVDGGSIAAAFAALTRGFDGGLHLGDEGFGFGLRVDYGGDEANVFIDVGERVRCEGEDGQAGFEDRGEGLHAVRDAGDDEIGMGGEDFVGVGSPAVVEDVGILGDQIWESFDAVASAGAEMVEAVEGGEGDGDRGLEGGYAHQH